MTKSVGAPNGIRPMAASNVLLASAGSPSGTESIPGTEHGEDYDFLQVRYCAKNRLRIKRDIGQ